MTEGDKCYSLSNYQFQREFTFESLKNTNYAKVLKKTTLPDQGLGIMYGPGGSHSDPKKNRSKTYSMKLVVECDVEDYNPNANTTKASTTAKPIMGRVGFGSG